MDKTELLRHCGAMHILRVTGVGAIATVLLMGMSASASAHYPIKSAHQCRFISFEPGTDFAAFDIKARRLRCRDAHKIVRRFVEQEDRSPFGFRCNQRSRKNGDRQNDISHLDVRCKRGGRALTFVVS